jgi:hypothetical protein
VMAGWRENRLFKVERKTAGDLDVDHHGFSDTTEITHNQKIGLSDAILERSCGAQSSLITRLGLLRMLWKEGRNTASPGTRGNRGGLVQPN